MRIGSSRPRAGRLAGLLAIAWIALSGGVGARPSVALVLSGGGALGFAHIGVLQVLEEQRVPVDCIVGTSMGALVGGAYAAGVSPDDMIESVTTTDILALFDDQPPRAEKPQQLRQDDYRPLFGFTLGVNDRGVALPAGASAGYKFEFYLAGLIGQQAALAGLDLDELPTPFRAVATDLETGDMRVFEEGKLSQILRASMSLPAIVAPTEIGDNIYVDGGLVRNLPVDVGRGLCGDVVIAVNLGTQPSGRDKLNSSLDIARQSIIILTEQNVRVSLQELKDNDVLILPELDGFSSGDFDKPRPLIELGAAAAQASLNELQRYAVPAEDYAAWQAERRARLRPDVLVTGLKTTTAGRVPEEAIRRDLAAVMEGETIDVGALDATLVDLYGRGDFSYVGYSIVPGGDGADVVIDATAKPWGPGYLRFGLGVATDLDSPTQFDLAGSYRDTWINELGAEWRIDAQIGYDSFFRTMFLQPLQIGDGAFGAVEAGIRRHAKQIFAADTRIGEINLEDWRVGASIGLTGPPGEIRLGPFFGGTDSEPGLGTANPVVPQEYFKQSGLQFNAVIDQLDGVPIPRSGLSASLDVRAVQADWGADADYVVARAKAMAAGSMGPHTFFGNFEWGDEIRGNRDNLPPTEAFELGGPRRLSGLYLDQLTGTRYNLASLSYYYQYADLPAQLGRGLFFGGSVEAGRIDDPLMKDTWDWVTGASVFWGADTALGPAYIGYGLSSLGEGTVYLTIGPDF